MRQLRIGLLSTLIAGMALLSSSCVAVYSLDILDGKTGALLKKIPIRQGEVFRVKFIHSVEKAPIIEAFYISNNGDIILKEVKFKKIGVGYGKYIPTLYPSVYEDGWHRMKDINVPVVLNYRIGYVADHTLAVRSRNYLFKDFMPAGELLKIVATKETSSARSTR